jgi:hypothetical protein
MLNTADKKSDSVTIDNILKKINQGNAILFLGSGFSASAHDLNDETMPTAGALARKISGLIPDFEPDDDLRYVTEYFLDSTNDHKELIKLLRETFTVKNVSTHHKAIASAPWRRIYTTNYDLCYERAAEYNGKVVETVDLSSNPADFSARNNLCVHLNGSLNSLNPESLNNTFKLTTSSYLSPTSFLDSNWFLTFKRDLEFASAIIFVGYSMYDIEIQKLLFQNSTFFEKTFFITRSSKPGKEKFFLEKFGQIVPIGTEGFGTKIQSFSFNDQQTDQELVSIWQYEVSTDHKEIRDKDVDNFLMFGAVQDNLIDSAIQGISGAPLLIPREKINLVCSFLENNRNVAITADFGNGKSIFLRELRTRLSLQGKKVFIVDKSDPYQHEDLDKLVKNSIKGILIIDSYDKHYELLQHYAELNPTNLKLVISTRTSTHEKYRNDLIDIGLELNEVGLNELSEREVLDFIGIIDNVGYWGKNAGSPNHIKEQIIKTNNNYISLNLLKFLSSPQIIDRIDEILKEFLVKTDFKDTIFSIALLSSDDMPLDSSLISTIAFNDAIYSSDLRNNHNFKNLFSFQGNTVVTKSSLFAITLIANHFSSGYIVDQLLKVVSSLDNSLPELKRFQRNLMRFSVVERLLPEKQRKQSLIRYYENLKRELTWLQNDPHFWLQYGMAQLTHKEYTVAQTYLDQAYALASRKNYAHTDHIDSQQARLYLLQAIDSNDSSDGIFQLFKKAHQLINKLENDIHKYRQVENYKDIYEKKYAHFSKGNKAYFMQSCKNLLRDLKATYSDGEKTLNNRRFQTQRIINMLEKITA